MNNASQAFEEVKQVALGHMSEMLAEQTLKKYGSYHFFACSRYKFLNAKL